MRRPTAEILVLVLVFFAACKNDDFHYPDLLTEIAEVDTDAQGAPCLMRTDDKVEYALTSKVTFNNGRADTTYRAQCRYVVEDSKAITLYSMQALISPHPESEDFFKEKGIKTDPVKLTSIWKSGDYINLHVGIMIKHESTHKVHFVKSELQETTDGHRRMDILLYHDRREDSEAYTQDVFLSCPLSSLELTAGDSVYFSLHTYDGLKTYGFAR